MKGSSVAVDGESPRAATFVPDSIDNTAVEFYVFVQIILGGCSSDVLPDLWTLCIEARPVRVGLEREGVNMRRNIAGIN